MGTDPNPRNQKQDDLTHEQRYKVEKITFVVEPQFQAEGNRTLGSVLLKLMQNEIDV